MAFYQLNRFCIQSISLTALAGVYWRPDAAAGDSTVFENLLGTDWISCRRESVNAHQFRVCHLHRAQPRNVDIVQGHAHLSPVFVPAFSFARWRTYIGFIDCKSLGLKVLNRLCIIEHRGRLLTFIDGNAESCRRFVFGKLLVISRRAFTVLSLLNFILIQLQNIVWHIPGLATGIL